MVLALSAEATVLWQVSLAVGAVVIAVVIVLLTLLVRLVGDVQEGVAGLWLVAKSLAANTASGLQLDGTASALDAVGAELQRHLETPP